MKYTFQDSTDLPVQRDFIEDLKNFVDACSKVLPVEKEAIEKNEKLVQQAEAKLAEIEALLADTELYTDEGKPKLMKLLAEQQAMQAQQEEAENAWMEDSEALEQARADYAANNA